ncbi:histidine acid phosphatase [Stachybotrys elegans]|uniref:Histidine acid phosphatase n=1 Tax=Stachybotrys elegans TaxID=80388 RepID=A0A8K0WKJ3_9HYPO|nr:histidine acid phosphatase [Stachybotrys elegans]
MTPYIIPFLGLSIGTALAETVHGVVVFTRHGDRTTKHYGSQVLTPLGASQNFQVGSDYRSRYLDGGSETRILGISEDRYVASQVYASSPNQGILSNTATAFLQGLYPPLSDLNQDLAIQPLNNGTDSEAPLNGYQYILLNGMDTDSPDTIWIKGDDACPAYTESAGFFQESAVFQERVETTREFYARMLQYLDGVYDMEPEDMTYAEAYNIFDLINVARIHNQSSPALEISNEDMFQLRTLADSHEFGENFNSSQPIRSIGAQTLAGGMLAQLEQTVSTQGKLKFSLLAGSYDTFLAFFGMMGLTSVSDDFYGLPEYASTMVFELFSKDTSSFPESPADLSVRWLFRNGTAGSLTVFPLFGQQDESLSWPDFLAEMQERAITNVGAWCRMCSSTADFCAAYDNHASAQGQDGQSAHGGLSNAAAGGIGAGVTLAVVAILGAIVFAVVRRRRASKIHSVESGAAPRQGKGSSIISVSS